MEGIWHRNTAKGAAVMVREKRSIVIRRPIDEVFAYVSDPRNNAAWNGWVVETTMIGDGPITAGSEFVTSIAFLGRRFESRAVITDLILNQRGSIRTTTGPVVATGTRTVEAVNGGTRFTQTLEADIRSAFGGIAEALVVRAGVRQMEADLRTLKRLLESGAAAGANAVESTASVTAR
jgi:uncharacterized membrane protein